MVGRRHSVYLHHLGSLKVIFLRAFWVLIILPNAPPLPLPNFMALKALVLCLVMNLFSWGFHGKERVRALKIYVVLWFLNTGVYHRKVFKVWTQFISRAILNYVNFHRLYLSRNLSISSMLSIYWHKVSPLSF